MGSISEALALGHSRTRFAGGGLGVGEIAFKMSWDPDNLTFWFATQRRWFWKLTIGKLSQATFELKRFSHK